MKKAVACKKRKKANLHLSCDSIIVQDVTVWHGEDGAVLQSFTTEFTSTVKRGSMPVLMNRSLILYNFIFPFLPAGTTFKVKKGKVTDCRRGVKKRKEGGRKITQQESVLITINQSPKDDHFCSLKSHFLLCPSVSYF